MTEPLAWRLHESSFAPCFGLLLEIISTREDNNEGKGVASFRSCVDSDDDGVWGDGKQVHEYVAVYGCKLSNSGGEKLI